MLHIDLNLPLWLSQRKSLNISRRKKLNAFQNHQNQFTYNLIRYIIIYIIFLRIELKHLNILKCPFQFWSMRLITTYLHTHIPIYLKYNIIPNYFLSKEHQRLKK